jgi:alkylated DNA repair dioxygenase AlkB
VSRPEFRIPQLSLFHSGGSVLLDDASGRIAYTPRFVSGPVAAAWFAELRDAVPWKAERRRMYDREVDVPRLTAHFHLGSEEAAPPDAIRHAVDQVRARTGVPFNSVGLNFYRDGRDSVAPHNDHLNSLVEGFPIGLLSLGGARRMTIRAKVPPHRVAQRPDSNSERRIHSRASERRTLHVDLEPGSLLMMSYSTQLHYTHGIPKTTDPVGPRISLAFRVKPARPAARDDAAGAYYR